MCTKDLVELFTVWTLTSFTLNRWRIPIKIDKQFTIYICSKGSISMPNLPESHLCSIIINGISTEKFVTPAKLSNCQRSMNPNKLKILFLYLKVCVYM